MFTFCKQNLLCKKTYVYVIYLCLSMSNKNKHFLKKKIDKEGKNVFIKQTILIFSERDDFFFYL